MEGFGSADVTTPFHYGSVADGVHHNPSLEQKLKKKYWKTKQTVIQKLHKSQDEFVVAGDADIDTKLEVAYHLRSSCQQLLQALEKYCYRLKDLSAHELAFGEYLGAYSENEYTNAGEVMQSTGKVLESDAKARMTVLPGLQRLYQEMTTFRVSALSDLNQSIQTLEKARTDYRAALLWMKDVSAKLHNPDYRDQLIRFREAQAAVKETKALFEKLKGDLSEKIDMVNASRCNLLSRSLPTYQKAMLTFTDSAATEFHRVLVNIRSHHHHQYKVHSDMEVIRDLESEEADLQPLSPSPRGQPSGVSAGVPLQSQEDDEPLIDMGSPSPPEPSPEGHLSGEASGERKADQPLVPLSPPPSSQNTDKTDKEVGVADLPLTGIEADLRALQSELLQDVGDSLTGQSSTAPSSKEEGEGGREEEGGGEEGSKAASLELDDLLGLGLGLEGEGEGGDLPDFGPMVSSEGPVEGEKTSTDVLSDQWNNFSSFMSSTRTPTKSSLSEWEKEFMEKAPATTEPKEDPFLSLDPLAAMKAAAKEGAGGQGGEKDEAMEASGTSSLADELLSLDLSAASPHPPPSSEEQSLVPAPLIPPAPATNGTPHPPPLHHPPFSSRLGQVGGASSKPHPPQQPARMRKEVDKKGTSWMNVFAHLDPLANEKA